MPIKKFYLTQSSITNPGKYAYLYDDLPDDLPEICKILQNLIMHYADESIYNYKIPIHRYREMDDRFVEVILKRIISRNPQSLTVEREVDQRFLGVCRDYAVLLCSILRHKKIPARLRSGFSCYFMPGFNLDSVCVEYWNQNKNKWCLVDSRTSSFYIEKLKIDFDLMDLPLTKFIPAETAWNLCRSGIMKANHFGSRHYRGLWYIRNRLIHEISFINKHEMLIWDGWGCMLSHKKGTPNIPEEDYLLLDQLEWMLREDQKNLNELRKLYKNHPGLRIPDVISVFNPFYKRRFDHVNI